MLNTLLNVTFASAALACPCASSSGGDVAIRAAVVHVDGGQAVAPGVVLVQDGKITAVGKTVEVPDGVAVVEHDGHLSAGMVAGYGYAGVWGESSDTTRSLLAEADVAHAFERDHPDLQRALAAGITSMILGPRDNNVVGGTTCVVKTSGGVVLADAAHLSVSFRSTAQFNNRFPTSPMGALAALEAELVEPSGRYAEVAAGELPVLLHCSSRHEIQRALDFAREHELRGAIKGAPLAGELVDTLKGSGIALIAGPFEPGVDHRAVESVVEVARAAVPVAFALEAPLQHADALRLSAAMCLREGWDAAAAWKALTSGAAAIAGVADQVGTVAAGKQADLVLWSGSPLDLASHVEAVFIDGNRVWEGAR